MRDPQRIEPLLALIRRIWTQHPDLRLCQLILNTSPGTVHTGTYTLEDDELRRRLEAMYQAEPSITCPHCGRTSSNVNDIRERYCSWCHTWHPGIMPAGPPEAS